MTASNDPACLKRIEKVEECPAYKGKRELLRHLNGEHLTASQKIQAKCYECNSYYVDGKADCNVPLCPLYPANPYRTGGKVKRRTVSQETREKIAAARRNRPSQGN